MLQATETSKYLEIVRELAGSYPLFDTHVHPFEIIYRDRVYHPDSRHDGLFSADSSEFSPPQIRDATLPGDESSRKIVNFFLHPSVSRRNLTRLYSHTGPTVFGLQMELSHISSVLLLPVASPDGLADGQMFQMHEMFGHDHRFSFATSVPNSVPNNEINAFALRAMERGNIQAIKLHPNITEIDLTATSGRARVETILEACGRARLPLIVHGGRSPLAENPEAAAYSCIQNLKNIDWGTSTSTVVIAHAGAYCCEQEEIRDVILPTLKELLALHNNLVVDLSGLDVSTLVLVLESIDPDRILFGSDALYEPQWLAVVKLLLALEKTTMNVEDLFLRITSHNPARYVFTNGTGHDSAAEVLLSDL